MPTPAPAMPPLPQDVEQFLTWMTDQKGFSPATISAYRTDLLQFEEWLHREQHSLARPGELEKYHFQDYSAHLFHEGQARSSIGRKLSALRSLFRYLMKMKKIDKNPAKLVRNPKRELRHPTALNVDQMFTLLDEASVESGGAAGLDGSRQAEQAVTDREHAGHTRDLALAELLYGSGLRISEALDLDVDDVDPASGFIRVIGKGSKERIAVERHVRQGAVPLAQGARAHRPARRKSPFRGQQRQAAQPEAGGADSRRDPQKRRIAATSVAAHPASHLRHAHAGERRGYALRAGTARPCQPFHHPALHAHHP